MLNNQSSPCRAVTPIVMASIIAQRGAPMTLAFNSLPLTALAMGGNGATRRGGVVGGCAGEDKRPVFACVLNSSFASASCLKHCFAAVERVGRQLLLSYLACV